MLVKELGLPSSGEAPGKVKSIDGCSLFIYRAIDVPMALKDSFGQERREIRQMWAVEMPGTDIVLGWSWLEDIDPII
jgi:hypothetical protein